MLYPVNFKTGGDLQPMTAAEFQTVANKVLEYFATVDGPGNIYTSDPGSGNIIGNFINTSYAGNVGESNVTIISTEATLYQDLSYPTIVNDFPAVLVYDTNQSSLRLTADAEIDNFAANILHYGVTNEGPGSYVIDTSAPAGGTWSVVGTLTDVVSNATPSVSYNLYKKIAADAYTLTRPLKVSNVGLQVNIQKLTDAEINYLATRVRQQIVNTRIGEYAFQAAAPATGTWVEKGTVLDTIPTTVATTFEGAVYDTTLLNYESDVNYDTDVSYALEQNYTGDTGTYTSEQTFTGTVSYNLTTAYELGTEVNYDTEVNFSSTLNYVGTDSYSSSVTVTYTGPATYTGTFVGTTDYAGTLNYSTNYISVSFAAFESNFVISPSYDGTASYTGNFSSTFTSNFAAALSYEGTVFDAFFVVTYTSTFLGYDSTVYAEAYLSQYQTTFNGPGPSFSSNYVSEFVSNFTSPASFLDTLTYTGTYSIGYVGPTFVGNFTGPANFSGPIDFSSDFGGTASYNKAFSDSFIGPADFTGPVDYTGTVNYTAESIFSYTATYTLEQINNPTSPETYTGPASYEGVSTNIVTTKKLWRRIA